MRRLPSRLGRHLVVALYAVAVLVASVVDPGTGGAGLGAAGPLGVGADKWLHALAYAALALLLAWARGARMMTSLLVALAVAVAVGAAVEAVQFALPARRFDVADLAANAVGAFVAVGTWRVGVRLRSRFTRASTLLRQ